MNNRASHKLNTALKLPYMRLWKDKTIDKIHQMGVEFEVKSKNSA